MRIRGRIEESIEATDAISGFVEREKVSGQFFGFFGNRLFLRTLLSRIMSKGRVDTKGAMK